MWASSPPDLLDDDDARHRSGAGCKSSEVGRVAPGGAFVIDPLGEQLRRDILHVLAASAHHSPHISA
jgi:hypothetical protein